MHGQIGNNESLEDQQDKNEKMEVPRGLVEEMNY